MALFKNIGTTLEMIKWEHSIFALPFALCGAMLAANGWPSGWQLTWIIVCMIAARSAAMAFNRVADQKIDALNPRTAMRALPAGTLSRKFAIGFIVFFCAVFVLGAAELNRLTLILSPVALAVVLAYSYTKRFTSFSHLVLGLALGIAPAAAWIAVRGTLDIRIILLTIAVMLWVGGFDVLYACQDVDFDRQHGLYSIPRSLGVPKALLIARLLHFEVIILLTALIIVFDMGPWAIAGLTLVAVLLAYEHTLVRKDDLSKMNAAFFTMNGIIAVVFFAGVALDLTLKTGK